MSSKHKILAATVVSMFVISGFVDCGVAYECSCGPYGGSSDTSCVAGLGMADELDMMECEYNTGAELEVCATVIGFIYLGDDDVEKVKFRCY